MSAFDERPPRSALRTLAIVAALAVLAEPSCQPAESLLQIDVQGDASYAGVRIALAANGGTAKYYDGVTFDQAAPFRAGLYVPGSMTGTVAIDATIVDGVTGLCLARGSTHVFGVAAGKIAAPVPLAVASTPGDCDATTSGTGGASGQDGSGGATGSGGIDETGTGGATASGGAIGSGGATGSGGASGSGGAASGGVGMGGVGGSIGSGGMGMIGTGGKGTGGMIIGTGGRGSGGAGGCGSLVDDMEDGDGLICVGSGRSGHWFTYVDNTAGSSVTPAPSDTTAALPVLLSTPRGTSRYAMHISGTDAQYGGLGCLLNNPVLGEAPKTYDASGTGYVGVHFFVKSNAGLYFVIQTSATIATKYGGTCTMTDCYGPNRIYSAASVPSGTWTEISATFTQLTAGVTAFRTQDLWSLGFQPAMSGTFDIYIDDVSFY